MRMGQWHSSGVRSLLAFCALALVTAVHAAQPGKVEAIANTVTDLQTGPTAIQASANSGSLTAAASRVLGTIDGAVSTPSFTDPRIPLVAGGASQFTVVGLQGVVPLSFNWTMTGSHAWSSESANVGLSFAMALSAPGFIDTVRWSISFVDGPASMGDFAGTLSNPFTVSAAGSNFVNQLPVGSWDGQGVRHASLVMQLAESGIVGSMEYEVSAGMSGVASATGTLALASVTVPTAAQLQPGAHLLLDNGQQILITAVPEPEAGAMLLAGLLTLAVAVRQRRRANCVS